MKKLLALVLALVMTMSLVTISNAAFSDADKIDHKEAVEVMNALGVINGMPDGSFAPAGNVTRAEMAKMITIIMLGDIDADAFKGTVTDLKDINGHWAEGYIKYCYSQGVIAGRGDGTFAPNANVTAVEAAKMLLVALGYNSDVQGYVGSDWTINVIRDAQLSKFFDDLSVTSTKVLTRDEAAQMIYNAVNAATIQKNSSVDRLTGKVTDIYEVNGPKLLTKTFNVIELEGKLTDVSNYDKDKKEYTYDIGYNAVVGGVVTPTSDSFKSTKDYSGLFMQNVKVLYKVTNNKVTVYGIYAKDSSVIATGVIADIKAPAAGADKVTINKVDYKLTGNANGIEVYENLNDTSVCNLDGIATYATDANKKVAYEFKLIDNTGDGKGDVVVVYPFTVVKVSYVGTKSFTASTSYKFEDVNAYTGLAKDDYVKVTAAANNSDGKVSFEKVEKASGTVQAVKVSDGKAQLNGTWYSTAFVSAPAAGDKCEYVAANGYLYFIDADGAKVGTADYVVVTKAADKTAGMDKTVTAQILKSDGTKTTVEVKKIGSDVVSSTVLPTVGSLYTYKVNDDGYYELTAAATTGTVFDVAKNSGLSYTAATSKKDGQISDGSTAYYIADEAVVFVKEPTSASTFKYSVTTGAKLKASTSGVSAVAYIGADNNSSSGYSYIKLAYVTATSLGTSTDKYAYVTGDVVKYQDTSDDNKFYVEIPVGDTALTTKSATAGGTTVVDTAYGLRKGDIIKYNVNADGKVDSITKYNMNALANDDGAHDFTAAVVAVEGNDVRFSNDYFPATGSPAADKTYDATLTSDTVVIYVDSSDNSVVEGGSIVKASSNVVSGTTSNYANVCVVTNASKEVVLLVVDVNNDILNLQ